MNPSMLVHDQEVTVLEREDDLTSDQFVRNFARAGLCSPPPSGWFRGVDLLPSP
ncbi:hypothetical protein [Streptomyces sp. NPDC018711]|uniref:hypothetical protein n=1 Tax=Streptomyces sp. NPDC018711 TaxID=3365052 RepID=UPI0037A37E0B